MKTITEDVYRQVMALCMLGNSYSLKADECNTAVMKLLGTEDGSHFSDGIYTREALTIEAFDEDVKLEKFIVGPNSLIEDAKHMAASLRAAEEGKDDPIFDDAARVIERLVSAFDRPEPA